MPDFKLGYAEKERQVDKSPTSEYKTGKPSPDLLARRQWSIFRSVGAAHFHWDKLATEEGNWAAAPNQ